MPDNGNGGNNNNNSQSSHHRSNNNNNYNQMAAVTCVTTWETQGQTKIFTGSKDGFWRLWTHSGNTFVREFEHNMGGPVECLIVASNFLFCGFECTSPSLPEVSVGMVHAWNLSNPSDLPLEFYTHPTLIPYAHNLAVTELMVVDGQTIVSGSKDGGIKVWSFANGTFALSQTLVGHAREITGLALADGMLLWSASADGAIRIWDMAKGGECKHCITSGAGILNPQAPGVPSQPPQVLGHTDAVTSLVQFKSNAGTFILSSSLDGTVKAWSGTNGQCVASEENGEGVVNMTMGADATGKDCLLIGLESGSLMVRNLEPTPKITKAFSLLILLTYFNSASHQGAVKALTKGPAGTFYSGGADGKVLVFQFVGDIGL